MKIHNHELFEVDANQIINMGGPYVCDLYMDTFLISNNVVVDNFIFNEKKNLLYFVKYYEGLKWQSDTYFTINSYHIETSVVNESNRHFIMVYLKKLINENTMEIFLAFHDRNVSQRDIFDLQEGNFHML